LRTGFNKVSVKVKGIRIRDHNIRLQVVAAFEVHTGCTTTLRRNFPDGFAGANLDSDLPHEFFESSRDRPGPSAGKKDPPFSLEEMNQAVNTRGFKGIPSDQERLDREGAAQTVTPEVAADQLPDSPLAAKTQEIGDLTEHRSY
jgi:hypothetical protein